MSKWYALVAHADSDRPELLPTPGTTVEHWMYLSERDAPKPIRRERDDAAGFDKDARLVVEGWQPLAPSLADGRALALVKVRLLTGRTHQIRAQMGLLGWSLENDLMFRSGFDKLRLQKAGVDIFSVPLALSCYRMRFSLRGELFDVEAPACDANAPGQPEQEAPAWDADTSGQQARAPADVALYEGDRLLHQVSDDVERGVPWEPQPEGRWSLLDAHPPDKSSSKRRTTRGKQPATELCADPLAAGVGVGAAAAASGHDGLVGNTSR